MASGTPLTGEQRQRIVRLAQQDYNVLQIKDMTGFAKSTIQNVLRSENVFPNGYIHRPRKNKKEAPKKSWIQRIKDLFGIGHPEPKKKRRHRKVRKEISL